MFGILCFGDSITFGRGEMPAIGWAGRLKEYFEAKDPYNGVYNLGVPGHTSSDLLKRFDAEATGRLRNTHKGSKFVIVVAIGTNDCKFDGKTERVPRTTEIDFEDNIKKLIEKAKSYDKEIVFIGLTPVDETKTQPYEETVFNNDRVKLFNDIVKNCCQENKIHFLDMYAEMSEKDYPNLLDDGLHPNSNGYEFMFETIKKFLEDNKII